MDLNRPVDRPLDHNFRPWLAQLAPPLQRLLAEAAAIAQAQGAQLYWVGGGVRDLLLRSATRQPRPVNLNVDLNTDLEVDLDTDLQLKDLDLVVEGEPGQSGAALAIAQALQQTYPSARLSLHGQFQTAALVWRDDPTWGSLAVDLATARTERYPYPAANPLVEASSIAADLYRRDFTINAMAVRLTEPGAGELLDPLGGWADLVDRQIRVLHRQSFLEDPTRLVRAVRFAVRLGFELEPQTQADIAPALEELLGSPGRGDRPLDQPQPALGSRLKAELKLLLELPQWWPALQRLAALGGLACLDRRLQFTPDLGRQLRWLARAWSVWQRRDQRARQAKDQEKTSHLHSNQARDHPNQQPSRPKTDPVKLGGTERWQLLLEGLLASLPTDEGAGVATRLQLPPASGDRLRAVAAIADCLEPAVSGGGSGDGSSRGGSEGGSLRGGSGGGSEGGSTLNRPSQRARLLAPFDVPSLLLAAAQLPLHRRRLWRAIGDRYRPRPPLNGHDLQALGYRAGPALRDLLAALQAAWLDGEITDQAGAITWLQDQFPPPIQPIAQPSAQQIA